MKGYLSYIIISLLNLSSWAVSDAELRAKIDMVCAVLVVACSLKPNRLLL